MKRNHQLIWLSLIALSVLLVSCGNSGSSEESASASGSEKSAAFDPMKIKGVGPVTSVTLGETIDQAMVAEGKEIYDRLCTACHKPETKFIGPPPKGILERRSPEWVMNMILNPEEMTQKDPLAKALLIEYNGSPMANQNLTEAEARAVLEYFRTL